VNRCQLGRTGCQLRGVDFGRTGQRWQRSGGWPQSSSRSASSTREEPRREEPTALALEPFRGEEDRRWARPPECHARLLDGVHATALTFENCCLAGAIDFWRPLAGLWRGWGVTAPLAPFCTRAGAPFFFFITLQPRAE